MVCVAAWLSRRIAGFEMRVFPNSRVGLKGRLVSDNRPRVFAKRDFLFTVGTGQMPFCRKRDIAV